MTRTKAPRYIRPRELRDVDWIGEGTFRVLSYYFVARWSWDSAGSYVRHLLGGFDVPPQPPSETDELTPGSPPVYSLVKAGDDGTARYRLLLGDYEVVSSPDPRDALNFLSWHIHSESTRRTGDYLLVHAGAVVSPSGVGILIPGAPGSGKTSLVAGLVREGFGYLSDEVGALDPVTRRMFPVPRPLALKPGTYTSYTEIREVQDPSLPVSWTWYVRPEELRRDALAGPCKIGLVLFPQYRPGAAARETPMSPAEATVEAARQTMNLSLYRSRAVLLLAEVVGRARSFRLQSGDVSGSVRLVNELLAGSDLHPA